MENIKLEPQSTKTQRGNKKSDISSLINFVRDYQNKTKCCIGTCIILSIPITIFIIICVLGIFISLGYHVGDKELSSEIDHDIPMYIRPLTDLMEKWIEIMRYHISSDYLQNFVCLNESNKQKVEGEFLKIASINNELFEINLIRNNNIIEVSINTQNDTCEDNIFNQTWYKEFLLFGNNYSVVISDIYLHENMIIIQFSSRISCNNYILYTKVKLHDYIQSIRRNNLFFSNDNGIYILHSDNPITNHDIGSNYFEWNTNYIDKKINSMQESLTVVSTDGVYHGKRMSYKTNYAISNHYYYMYMFLSSAEMMNKGFYLIIVGIMICIIVIIIHVMIIITILLIRLRNELIKIKHLNTRMKNSDFELQNVGKVASNSTTILNSLSNSLICVDVMGYIIYCNTKFINNIKYSVSDKINIKEIFPSLERFLLYLHNITFKKQ